MHTKLEQALIKADESKDIPACMDLIRTIVKDDVPVDITEIMIGHTQNCNLPMLQLYYDYLKPNRNFYILHNSDIWYYAALSKNTNLIDFWIDSCLIRTLYTYPLDRIIDEFHDDNIIEYLFSKCIEGKLIWQNSDHLIRYLIENDTLGGIKWLYAKSIEYPQIIELKISEINLKQAAYNCSIDVLKWLTLEMPQLEFKINHECFYCISCSKKPLEKKLNTLKILQDVSFRLPKYPLDHLFTYYFNNDSDIQEEILEFWKELYSDKLDLLISRAGIWSVFRTGFVTALRWIYKHKQILFEYDEGIVNVAAASNHICILNFLIENSLPLYNTPNTIEVVAEHGNVETLKFLKDHCDFVYTNKCVDKACKNTHIKVLSWFSELPTEFKFSKDAIIETMETLRCYLGLCSHVKHESRSSHLPPISLTGNIQHESKYTERSLIYHSCKFILMYNKDNCFNSTDKFILMHNKDDCFNYMDEFITSIPDMYKISLYMKILWFWRQKYDFYNLRSILDERYEKELFSFDDINLKEVIADSEDVKYSPCVKICSNLINLINAVSLIDPTTFKLVATFID